MLTEKSGLRLILDHQYFTQQKELFGHGCGTAGRMVASESRSLQFKSSHRSVLNHCVCGHVLNYFGGNLDFVKMKKLKNSLLWCMNLHTNM